MADDTMIQDPDEEEETEAPKKPDTEETDDEM